jgi:hypothetical protein
MSMDSAFLGGLISEMTKIRAHMSSPARSGLAGQGRSPARAGLVGGQAGPGAVTFVRLRWRCWPRSR